MTQPRTRWPLAIAVLASLAAAPAALAQLGTPPPPAPPAAPVPSFPPPPVPGGPPGVAAVVNGQSVSRTEVERIALAMAGQQALQQVIANTLVDQEAKRQGVTATPAELDARIAQLRQSLTDRYPGGLDAFLHANNTSLDDLKSNLRIRIEAEKLASKGQKPVHRAHIHYIVILTANPGGDPTKKPHTDAEAQAIIAKAQADLKAGQAFESVAAKYTEDSGKSTGGDIGIVGPDSSLDPAFIQAALALKPGEVTPTPVHSAQFGYFLLKAVSTSESATGPEKALYAQADQQQSRQQVQTYLQTLLKSAKITNYFTP
ncbi:MAG: peptidylprolyl isomerase [Armatimonadetes bacterium]|nr:peptidylprolyl isomerase [Armatimonadota bacterium]